MRTRGSSISKECDHFPAATPHGFAVGIFLFEEDPFSIDDPLLENMPHERSGLYRLPRIRASLRSLFLRAVIASRAQAKLPQRGQEQSLLLRRGPVESRSRVPGAGDAVAPLPFFSESTPCRSIRSQGDLAEPPLNIRLRCPS